MSVKIIGIKNLIFLSALAYSFFHHNVYSTSGGLPLALNTTEGGVWQSLIAGNPALLAGNENVEINFLGGVNLGASQMVSNYGGAISLSANKSVALSAGYLQGDSLYASRFFNFTGYGANSSEIEPSSTLVPISLSAKLNSWLSFGLSTRFQTDQSFTLSQASFGLLMESKKGFKMGLYLPQLNTQNVELNRFSAGISYQATNFTWGIDYVYQSLVGTTPSLAAGIVINGLTNLQVSINLQMPLGAEIASDDGILASLQIQTYLRYFLGNSFFVQGHFFSGGILMGGLGFSF